MGVCRFSIRLAQNSSFFILPSSFSFGRAASREKAAPWAAFSRLRRAIRGSLRSYLAAMRAFGALMSAAVRVASRRAATIPLAARPNLGRFGASLGRFFTSCVCVAVRWSFVLVCWSFVSVRWSFVWVCCSFAAVR